MRRFRKIFIHRKIFKIKKFLAALNWGHSQLSLLVPIYYIAIDLKNKFFLADILSLKKKYFFLI